MSEQPPGREPHQAWAGPSGLRIERLAAPVRGCTITVEPAPAGEPLWLTPGHWADLCAAAAELGPGWAAPPAGPGGAAPAAPQTRGPQ